MDRRINILTANAARHCVGQPGKVAHAMHCNLRPTDARASRSELITTWTYT